MSNVFFGKYIKKSAVILLAWVTALLFTASITNLPQGGTQETSSKQDIALLKEIFIKGNIISVRTDKPVSYNVFKVGSPPRLVLELNNTENNWKKKEISLRRNSIFSRVRAAQFQNEPVKIARVVMELKSAVEYEATAEDNIIVITAKNPLQKTAAAPTSADIAQPNSKTDPLLVQAIPQSDNMPSETIVPQETPVVQETPPAPEAPKQAPAKSGNKGTSFTSTNPTALFGRQREDIIFPNGEIKSLFRFIATKSGVNIVCSELVSGNVSLELIDVPLNEAMDTILSLTNLRLIVLGRNIVRAVTPVEYDSYKTDAITTTKVFNINYADAAEINTQIYSILATLKGKGKTQIDTRTNSIIVTDTPSQIEVVEKLVADLDKPTPQVMIEAKIVEVALGKNMDLGITWGAAYTDRSGGQMVTIGATREPIFFSKPGALAPGTAEQVGPLGETEYHGKGNMQEMSRTPIVPGGGSDLEVGGSGFSAASGLGLSFGFVKDVVRLNAALNALQQKSKLKTLSNPKIATLNNKEAMIKSETSEPYITTETTLIQQAGVTSSQKVNKAVSGISLKVTPTINADGRITMKIIPDITTSKPTSIGIPITTSQVAETTVIVKDGETFVIGGLIRESDSDEKSYVPILGSIPILGHLFKKTATSKSRRELLVFVTPTIIPY